MFIDYAGAQHGCEGFCLVHTQMHIVIFITYVILSYCGKYTWWACAKCE